MVIGLYSHLDDAFRLHSIGAIVSGSVGLKYEYAD